MRLPSFLEPTCMHICTQIPFHWHLPRLPNFWVLHGLNSSVCTLSCVSSTYNTILSWLREVKYLHILELLFNICPRCWFKIFCLQAFDNFQIKLICCSEDHWIISTVWYNSGIQIDWWQMSGYWAKYHAEVAVYWLFTITQMLENIRNRLKFKASIDNILN